MDSKLIRAIRMHSHLHKLLKMHPTFVEKNNKYLHVVTGKCRSTQSLLRLIHEFSLGNAQYEGGLICSSSSRGDPVSALPSPVDPLTWVQKIQLHHLH